VLIPWVHKQTLLCAWKHTFGGLLEAGSCAFIGLVLCLCPCGTKGSRLQREAAGQGYAVVGLGLSIWLCW